MIKKDCIGFAIVSKDRSGISFENKSLSECKRYCYGDNIVVITYPKLSGFTINIMFWKPRKLLSFKDWGMKNILWLHFRFNLEYIRILGKKVGNNNVEL